jgi:hypothetical protein
VGRPWSLGNPHPDHQPKVLGYIIGNPTGRNGGQRKGTALGCSCGQEPVLVSKRPPTGKGRAEANAHYQAHVALALTPPAEDHQFGEPPCLS